MNFFSYEYEKFSCVYQYPGLAPLGQIVCRNTEDYISRPSGRNKNICNREKPDQILQRIRLFMSVLPPRILANRVSYCSIYPSQKPSRGGQSTTNFSYFYRPENFRPIWYFQETFSLGFFFINFTSLDFCRRVPSDGIFLKNYIWGFSSG